MKNGDFNSKNDIKSPLNEERGRENLERERERISTDLLKTEKVQRKTILFGVNFGTTRLIIS